jgi:hypothetical protein
MKANQCFSLSGFDFKGGFCDNATGLVGIQIDSIMATSNIVGSCLFSLFLSSLSCAFGSDGWVFMHSTIARGASMEFA